MKAACVIPARYGSTRFPGKPLALDTGKFLVQHVYERAIAADCFDTVVIATDDERIYEAADSFGARVIMTSPHHPSGTDRIAEIAEKLPNEIFVNLQGDEPEIRPELLQKLVRLLDSQPDAQMATLATAIHTADELLSPNVVKVVCDLSGRALYFSRSTIPFDRDRHLRHQDWLPENVLKHIGLYAYRREFLLQYPSMPRTPLEKLESLEQLRAMEHGKTILVAKVDYQSRGIDTPEDYAAFVNAWRDGVL